MSDKITLNQFIEKYLGKQVEYHSYGSGAKYQCVDLVNTYLVEVLGLDAIIGTDAKDFSTRYNPDQLIFVKNSLLAIVQKGDIPVWINNVGGGAGHVSVSLGGGLRKFISLDQNWSVAQTVTEEEHIYSGVSGWLRAKESHQELNDLREEVKSLRNDLATSQDHEKFWFDALKMVGLSPDSKWKHYKAVILKLYEDEKLSKDRIRALEEMIAVNTTGLDSKKDGKYVYDNTALILEFIRRLKGGELK